MPPAVLPGGAHQALDLNLSQVLAGAEVRVGKPLGRNCSFYGGWRDQPGGAISREASSPRGWSTVRIILVLCTVIRQNAEGAGRGQ